MQTDTFSQAAKVPTDEDQEGHRDRGREHREARGDEMT
jgi:hypothetical protein